MLRVKPSRGDPPAGLVDALRTRCNALSAWARPQVLLDSRSRAVFSELFDVARDVDRLERKERKEAALQALRAHIEEGYQQSLRGESTDGEEFFT